MSWLHTVIVRYWMIMSLTIFFLEKIRQKQYLDILDANLVFGGLVIELKTLNYSICGIPSTVLKIIA